MSRSLRDQFVSGVADVETQRKLLEVERDFDACIKIALSAEVASKESVSVKSSSAGVNFVKHNKPKNKPDSAKKYKGKRQNKLSDVCSYCHKKNHTAKICFKRIREEKSKGDKPTCYNMFNVSGTAAPLLVNVKIDNKIVTMEADSGAAISVMSVDNFIKLNISDYTTRETYDTVRSVTGTQKVHSIVTVPVTVHSKTYRLDLRLLDASCPNLYGRDWIQANNVSIDHIMREINKLTTVDVMHFDHGNDMHTHSDHGNEMNTHSDHDNDMHTHSDHDNDMHTHSEHGNEMQPIVNMCNDILCDENGSGSDIDSIYDVVCNNVVDLNKLEQVFEPCPSDTLYTVDHMSPCSGLLSKHKKLFSELLGKFTKGEAKLLISESQTPVYAKTHPLPYAIKEKVEDELSNMVKQNLISPVSHSNWAAPIVPIQKMFRICGDFKVTINKVYKPDSYPLPRIDDLYAKLPGGTVFSVLDLSMAYQQIPISQESKAVIPNVGRTPHRWGLEKIWWAGRFFSSLPNFFFLLI